MKKFILIDGNALVHRAFHALPALTSAKGVVTNAVFGFTSILLRAIRELNPDYIAAAFDLAGPTVRHEEFAEYKSHRVKAPDELYRQIPLVKEMLTAFGVPVYEKESYEADDLIGTLATKAKKEKDVKTIIVTGDLDTLQLVDDDKVVVFTLRKGVTDTVIYDEKAIAERFGLKPEQLNDFKGLKGDPSDNIPGVPGVGEKTAAELIKNFNSLDELYEYLEKSEAKSEKRKTKKSAGQKAKTKEKISEKLAEKLLEHKEQAFFSKQLSTIYTDLDVDFSLAKADWRKNLDLGRVETIMKDLGFFSLLKRLPEIGLDTLDNSVFTNPPDGKSVNSDRARGEKKEEENSNKRKQSGPKAAKNIFFAEGGAAKLSEDIISSPKHQVVGHDLKNVLKPFIKKGTEIKCRLFDTKIAAYLLYPDLRDYDFDKVFYMEFGENAPGSGSDRLWRLKNHLWAKLEAAKMDSVFEDIEEPLIKVLAEMELNGVKINTKTLVTLLESTNKELASLEKKIFKQTGEEFNINSPRQLGKILFEKLQLKGRVRKTGGGALSTAAPELEKLRDEHPIINLILDYRELQKLKTTYIEPFPVLVAEDGRIHTTYNQTGAATGRLASQDPNLQNIPVRTELGQKFRRAFVAEKGWQLVSFDYSQLDLRVVAHIADDKKMIRAFQDGEDIHSRTASEIFGVKPSEVTPQMRRQAKVLNFGIIYGMGVLSFSRSAGVDRARAKEFIEKYFKEFSGVAGYMNEIKKKARHDGYVETIFGRRRKLLDIFSTMPQIQAAAERAAINHPVQGTAADLMKLAMIEVYEYLRENSVPGEVKILLQVHDELVFEIKDEVINKFYPEIKKIMETVHKLSVPLVVDVKTGRNWSEQKDLELNR